MSQKDFIYINVPGLLNIKENRWFTADAVARAKRIVIAYISTEIHFLMDTGLLRGGAPARQTPLDQAVVRFSELTEEGQDFIMSQAMVKWLGACDRKSNNMFKRGASEEESLAIYANPKGLYKRLEKFRKERNERAN